MVVLKTERLLLRNFVPDDLDSLYALYRDPEMRRYFPDGTRTREETEEELNWFLDGHPARPELGLWATLDRQSGEFLGRCGLLPWRIAGVHEVELAFLITKSRWGQGLATEAARAIMCHAHATPGLDRLVCLIMPGNAASEAVARKIGMTFEREVDGEPGQCKLFSVALPAQ